MLCCCKECKYKNHNDKFCYFLKAQLKYIKCCPMMIQDELLNNAEKYMKENEPKIFMQYILKETGISFKVGDLVSVLDATFFWHSYGERPTQPKYLKINKVLKDGSFEYFDPF